MLSALALEAGLNLYGAPVDPSFAALRPYFRASLGVTGVVGVRAAESTALSLSAGGGLEYWVLPRLSVNVSMLLGVSVLADAETNALVFGTVHPGLGVTLYTR